MSLAAPVAVALAAVVIATLLLRSFRMTAARAEFIRSYTLPNGLYDRLRKRRPGLTLKDCQLTGHALRQFFLAYFKSGRQFVSMPSQLADDLWHEFILYTKNYEFFCKRAFGRFLHHSPAAVLGSSTRSNIGLRRVWWFACREENINPARPTRLPLLFALDSKLKIDDGFHYAADCSGLREANASGQPGRVVYCGGDFASVGTDGGTVGSTDGDSSGGATGSGDGHGHGHGCSGHGCSGGSGCGGSGCGGGGCGGGD
jgi:hypothetical protein